MRRPVISPEHRLNDMGRIERSREIARKRARKIKLKKLRTRISGAKNESEKGALLEKARRVSPFATFE